MSFALEAPPGIGPGMRVLQTRALPLGHGAVLTTGILYHVFFVLSMLFRKIFLFLINYFISMLCVHYNFIDVAVALCYGIF